jgi:hypothetical protein
MKRTHATQIIDINLLPKEQRPPELSVPAASAGLLVLAAVVAIVPVALHAADARASADAVQRDLDRVEASFGQMQTDLSTYRALRIELDETNTELAQLREERRLLQGGTRPLAEDLAYLWAWGYLPPRSRITQVAGTDTGFVVEGTAPGPLDAIAYAERLVNGAGFAAARTTSFAPGAAGGTFMIEVTR